MKENIEKIISNLDIGFLTLNDLILLKNIQKSKEWDIVEIKKPLYYIKNLNIELEVVYDFEMDEDIYFLKRYQDKERIEIILKIFDNSNKEDFFNKKRKRL